MKAIETWVSTVLVIVISISAIILVFQFGNPASQRTKEMMVLQNSKNILITIDDAVRDVSYQGSGSTRKLDLVITEGTYFIDAENESVRFVMETKSQIIGVGVSKMEDNINITGYTGKIYLTLKFNNTNITDEGEFSKGVHILVITNNGWDIKSKKTMISFSVK